MRTGTPESENSVPLDAILSAAANEQRRAVLRLLSHTEREGMEVSALADQVAEHVGKGGPLTDEHRQRIRTALHHIHLPKLEACGTIVHDPKSELVRRVNGELEQELLTVAESYEAHE